jgi:CshA-type fibril repeat protein
MKNFTVSTFLFVLLISITNIQAQVADAARATTGTGLYKEKIFWLNWDLNDNSATGDIITNGTTRTFTSPAGVIYAATVSNVFTQTTAGAAIVPATLRSESTYGWSGNNMPSGYGNIGGTTGAGNIVALSNGSNGNLSGFRVTFTATYPNGTVGLPAAVVIGGAESLDSGNEYYTLSVPNTAGTIRYMDKYIQNNTWANMQVNMIYSNGGRTVRVTNSGTGNSRGDALMMVEDVSFVDATTRGAGLQSFAIGFMEELDYSDAPISYGKATHIVNSSLIGGAFPDGSNVLSTTTNTADTQRGTLSDPTMIIGTDIDSDANYTPVAAGADPNGDDSNVADDEDGLPTGLALCSDFKVNIKNATSRVAYLNTWVDINRNGTFDSNERVVQSIAANTTGLVNVSLAPLGTLPFGTKFYTRLRLTTDATLTSPIGFSNDGEVEDHWMTIANCQPVAVNDVTTGPFNTPQTINLLSNDASDPNAGTYRITKITIAGTDYPIAAGSSVTVIIPGIGTVTVASDGSTTFTPVNGYIGTAANLFTYTAISPLGSGTTTATYSPTVICPTPTATTPANQVYCDGETTAVTSLSGTPIGVVFDVTGGTAIGLTNQTDATQVPAFTTINATSEPIVATISISPKANGCTGTSVSYTITVNPKPVVSPILTGGPTTFCSGGSVSLSAPTAPAGQTYNYQWQKDGTAIGGAINQSYTATATGTYSVIVTTSFGCKATSTPSIDVLVNTPPVAEITSGAITSPSCGSNVTLTANTGTGYTYIWYKNGIEISGETSNTLTAIPPITGIDTYTLKVTDANGCSAISTPAIVEAPPSASANGPLTICEPGTVTLTATTSASQTSNYQWKKDGVDIVGANSTTFIVSESGNYTFHSTNSGGQQATATCPIEITVNPIPISTALIFPSTICAGSTAEASVGTFSSYVWSFNGNPIAGATNQTYTAELAGNYTVKVTDINGCEATSPEVTLTIKPVPVLTSTLVDISACLTIPVAAIPLSSSTSPNTVFNYSGGSSIGLVDASNMTEIASFIPTSVGTVTITVTPVLDGCEGTPKTYQIIVKDCTPLPTDDSQTGLAPGTNSVIDILANDKLSDGSPATTANTSVSLTAPATATGVVIDANGNITSFTVPGQGSWTYDPTTGQLTFDPVDGFTTDPTPITYTLIDTATGISATASVTVDYTEVAPVATDDSQTGLAPGTNSVIDILANDKLSDGSPATTANTSVSLTAPATATGVVTDANGNITSFTVPGQGSWTYNPATGQLTFDPIGGFTSDPTPIAYTLTETATGLSATANVTVDYTEVPPVPTDDSQTGLAPGTNAVLNILANDKLSDGSSATTANTSVSLTPPATATGIVTDANGNITSFTVPGEGSWTYDPATGQLTFDPIAGFTSDPTPIAYTLTETATGLSATANVNVDYTEVPPVANDDSQTGLVPGTNSVIDILANDKLSDGSPATTSNTSVSLTAPATATGIVTDAGGNVTSFTVPGEGSWTYNPATGELTFDPIDGFTTDPTPITYTLTETATRLTETASITVGYTEVPPVPTDDSQTGLAPGTNAALNILANDKLSDGSPATTATTSVSLTAPATATGIVTDVNGNITSFTVPGQGSWTYDPTTGQLTFDPIDGFTTDPTPIAYTLTETLTGQTETANVLVEYTEVPPVANDDSQTDLDTGTNSVIDILANDKLSDGSPATTANTSVSLTAPATATGVVTDANGNITSFAVPAQGTWTYNPATGQLTFDPIDGFTTNPTPIVYTLKETATGKTETATVTVTYKIKLPVTLLNFDVKSIEAANILNWKVSNETDFGFYEIQHSVNISEFQTIATINPMDGNFYSWKHKNPSVGENYYRLKMVDLDGSFTYSKWISIINNKQNLYLEVQNPAVQREFIVFSNIIDFSEIRFVTSLGVPVPIVWEKISEDKFIIKVSPSAHLGLYYLIHNNIGLTKKIIIR